MAHAVGASHCWTHALDWHSGLRLVGPRSEEQGATYAVNYTMAFTKPDEGQSLLKEGSAQSDGGSSVGAEPKEDEPAKEE